MVFIIGLGLDILPKNSGAMAAFNLILAAFVYFSDDGSPSFVILNE